MLSLPTALSYCTILHPPFLSFTRHAPPTAVHTLSLHDALPIYRLPAPRRRLLRLSRSLRGDRQDDAGRQADRERQRLREDRKSTRLNSSHVKTSYAVFCLKKKRQPVDTMWSSYSGSRWTGVTCQ